MASSTGMFYFVLILVICFSLLQCNVEGRKKDKKVLGSPPEMPCSNDEIKPEVRAETGEKSYRLTASCFHRLYPDYPHVPRTVSTTSKPSIPPIEQINSTKIYTLSSILANFNNAAANCKAEGKRLATIMNSSDRDVIERVIIDQGNWETAYWIGGQVLKNKQSWYGTFKNIIYGKWQQGYPKNTKDVTCVILNDNNRFHWTNVDCSRYANYICEPNE